MQKKHETIYRDLIQKIIHGVYPAKTYLPSENELAHLYGVSRETVRKVLAILLENGFIHKIKGKGSLVLTFDRYTFPISSLTGYQELDELFDMHSRTKVLQLKSTTVPKATFNLEQDENIPATYIQRLRIINNEPLIIDNDYILQDIVPEIDRSVAEKSLYRYFEKQKHLKIGYASKEITVATATLEQQQILQLKPGSSVVIVKCITHLQDNTLLQYNESVHRSDKFKFVEHARRQLI
jgi:GntR family trehalose operon transcriptional repressor